MSLLVQSGLTSADLARRLNLDAADDEAGLTLALEAASSDIEPLVQVFDATLPIPAGLRMAILDVAATRYDRTSLSTRTGVGSVSDDYTDEYNQMMLRIAPYRTWAGV
jgi:hypothetical protein